MGVENLCYPRSSLLLIRAANMNRNFDIPEQNHTARIKESIAALIRVEIGGSGP